MALLISSVIGLSSGSVARGADVAGVAERAPQVVARPCPDSEFTCITLRVPLDHFAPAGGLRTDVTFALLRASGGTRKGVFVTATGGPGTSGIAVADGYTSALDPRIAEEYDIVFFDQRGIGLSGPIQCSEAVLELYTTPAVPTISPAAARAYARTARAFSADCVDEMDLNPARLAFYATRQVVEDLEVFRVWLKADSLHLYGESYGTQYAQVYASAHPDRVATLLLDGPVDLTLTGNDYYHEGADAFEGALTHTLDACSLRPVHARRAGRHRRTGGIPVWVRESDRKVGALARVHSADDHHRATDYVRDTHAVEPRRDAALALLRRCRCARARERSDFRPDLAVGGAHR